MWRGSLGDAVIWAGDHEPRGEFVVVVDGAPEAEPATDDEIRDAIGAALRRGLTARDAAAEVASALGVPKRQAYAVAVDVQR